MSFCFGHRQQFDLKRQIQERLKSSELDASEIEHRKKLDLSEQLLLFKADEVKMKERTLGYQPLVGVTEADNPTFTSRAWFD